MSSTPGKEEDDHHATVEDHFEEDLERLQQQPSSSHRNADANLRKRTLLKDIQEEDEPSSADSTPSSPSYDGNNNPSRNTRTQRVTSTPANPPTTSSPTTTSSLPLTPRDEYINCLNRWMVSVQAWKSYRECMAATLLASTFMNQNQSPFLQQSQQQQATAAQRQQPIPEPEPRIVRVPKLWKRVTAEVIDFFILLVIKIFVTYIAIDYFDLIDLEKFDLSLIEFNILESINTSALGGFADDDFEQQLNDVYKLAFEMSSEILVMESIHRIIVIIYEAFFLSYNWFSRLGGRRTYSPGASTPGKYVMGLQVISCTQIDDVAVSGEYLIRVTPSGDIGFLWSLLRAVIKNFSSVFFLPASLTVFMSRHSRAAYDAVCGCIVVENP